MRMIRRQLDRAPEVLFGTLGVSAPQQAQGGQVEDICGIRRLLGKAPRDSERVTEGAFVE